VDATKTFTQEQRQLITLQVGGCTGKKNIVIRIKNALKMPKIH